LYAVRIPAAAGAADLCAGPVTLCCSPVRRFCLPGVAAGFHFPPSPAFGYQVDMPTTAAAFAGLAGRFLRALLFLLLLPRYAVLRATMPIYQFPLYSVTNGTWFSFLPADVRTAAWRGASVLLRAWLFFGAHHNTQLPRPCLSAGFGATLRLPLALPRHPHISHPSPHPPTCYALLCFCRQHCSDSFFDASFSFSRERGS